MKHLLVSILLFTTMESVTIFDFNKKAKIQEWKIVDDTVMGGRSSGIFYLSTEGFGVFEGNIFLENNGGFSSLRYQFGQLKVNDNSKIILSVKGDGKNYQLRIKDDTGNYYSYITSFSTSGEWQKIEIQLSDMYPSFRGRRLNSPNFSRDSFEEITFLIGNKKNEKFKLLIDKIELVN